MENIVCLDDLLQDVNHLRSSRQQVLIYVREKIHDEFIDFLGGKGINSKYAPGNVEYRFDKFLAIAAVIYRNTYCAHRYRLENSDPVVTAMKFMDKGRNDRVYCREMTTVGGKVVILCEIHKKKNNENKKKEKNIIKKVAEYEFKIHS
ncbi:MAG: hypothetical protein M0Q99_11135 [Candidatus Cloacimonetes bacterium]|nr:hypothetical protein [Candidatus Cloacimonadota bacterium]MDD3543377.1 hypothetical protein [Petrimonas sp.]